MQFIITPEDIEEWETLLDSDENEPTTYAEAIGLDDFDVVNDR